jgi:ABC-2 type transport system permease protein
MQSFVNMYRAEWLKLGRGALPLSLLALFLLLLALQLALQFLVAALAQGSFGGVTIELMRPPQVAQYRAAATLPGAFGTAFGHANGLGGIFAIILTAGALGNEYSWGTLRTTLVRLPARGMLLVAKTSALLALLALALLFALLLAGTLGLLFGALLDAPPALGLATFGALLVGCLRALYVLLPYVLLTLLFTVLGRSTLAGVAGGLLYLTFEVGLGGLTLSNALSGGWKTLYNLTIGQNINTLVVLNSQSFGLDPSALTSIGLDDLPSPAQAVLLIAVYSASFLAGAIWLLRRRDIHGPG